MQGELLLFSARELTNEEAGGHGDHWGVFSDDLPEFLSHWPHDSTLGCRRQAPVAQALALTRTRSVGHHRPRQRDHADSSPRRVQHLGHGQGRQVMVWPTPSAIGGRAHGRPAQQTQARTQSPAGANPGQVARDVGARPPCSVQVHVAKLAKSAKLMPPQAFAAARLQRNPRKHPPATPPPADTPAAAHPAHRRHARPIAPLSSAACRPAGAPGWHQSALSRPCPGNTRC